MKRSFSLVCLLLILATLLTACKTNTPEPAFAGVIQVAANGDDANDGVKAPVKTVARALELAKEKINSGNVTIDIANGTYNITEPLSITNEFTNRDNGYTLTLQGHENSVISGGVSVTGWEKHADNIWKAQVTGVDSANGFYINGIPMTLAEMSIKGSFNDENRKGGIVMNTKEVHGDFSSYNINATIVKCSFSTVDDYDLSLEDLKGELDNMRMYFDQTFMRTCFRFSDVLKNSKGFTFVADQETLNMLNGAKMADYSAAHRYFTLINSYLFLDSQNEYYFDEETKTMYFYSSVSPEGSECVIPVSEGLLNIEGTTAELASNIKLQNLSFAYGTTDVISIPFKEDQSDTFVIGQKNGDKNFTRMPLPAQITMLRASNVTIDNCKFSNFDSSGIAMREHVYNSAVTNCDIKNMSGSGIVIGKFNESNGWGIRDTNPHPENLTNVTSVKKNSVIPAQIKIVNNVIEHCGTVSPGSNGILMMYGYNTDILNNTVQYIGGTGISVGWGWGNYSIGKQAPRTCGNVRVEANKVISPCMNFMDVGGIYTLGAFFEDGCLIKNNFIDMTGACEDDIPTIYLDEGSEFVTATGNVSVNTRMWIHCRALPVAANELGKNTIMNCSLTGNYTNITSKQLGYGGGPWPYASQVKGAKVTISDNTTVSNWQNDATVMAIVNAAGAKR